MEKENKHIILVERKSHLDLFANIDQLFVLFKWQVVSKEG